MERGAAYRLGDARQRRDPRAGRQEPSTRSTGCFARAIGRYTRERKVLGLMDALAKATILPAAARRDRGPRHAHEGPAPDRRRRRPHDLRPRTSRSTDRRSRRPGPSRKGSSTSSWRARSSGTGTGTARTPARARRSPAVSLAPERPALARFSGSETLLRPVPARRGGDPYSNSLPHSISMVMRP